MFQLYFFGSYLWSFHALKKIPLEYFSSIICGIGFDYYILWLDFNFDLCNRKKKGGDEEFAHS
jgi:hypothetical protein